ncbi:MAG: glycine oxidase ThiO [Rhizobiales bacterium]|nr:glycine oxidase ThiO [Hyphomicrobiales bacterium]
MKITIIGAGIAGLTCALELNKSNIDVEIIDKAAALGGHACSWYAGGMLAPWCEFENAEQPILDYGIKSLDWWRKNTSQVVEKGSLVVAQPRDIADLKQFSNRTHGYEWLGQQQIEKLEPELEGRFAKALYFEQEAHLDVRKALLELEQNLKNKGISIQYNTEFEDVSQFKDSDYIVDCTGYAAKDKLPGLRGVKGEMLLIQTNELHFSRPIRMLHPRIPLYIVPRDNGVYMVGATMIESDQKQKITARSMIELLSAAYALHPAFGEAEIVEIGTEIRPAFSDNLPKIIKNGKVIYVNGFYRHGYLMAPAIAQILANKLTNQAQKFEFIVEWN